MKKLNIVDYIIIALLIAVVAFVGYRKFNKKQDTSGGTEKALEVSFMAENINSSIAQLVKEGQPTMDTQRRTDFGKVKSIELKDSIFYGVDEKGQMIRGAIDGYNSVYVTTEAAGNITENGFEVGKYKYFIGDQFPLQMGDSVIYVFVSGVKER